MLACGVDIAGLGEIARQRAPRHVVRGIEFDRAAECVAGLVALARHLQGNALIERIGGVARVECDRACVPLQRLGQLPDLLQGIAEIAGQHGVLRLAFGGGPERGDGAIRRTRAQQQEGRETGADRVGNGRGEQFFRIGAATLPVAGGDMLAQLFDGRVAIHRCMLPQPAAPMSSVAGFRPAQ